MPRGDGTGPRGQGPQTGRGRGQGAGGRGRGGVYAAGPSGRCVCPSCGKQIEHQAGFPCYEQICPECGAFMIRE